MDLASHEEQIMVSVYCLAYNHEKYIRETLEGFVNQKTNFKYEVFVHDDASTDGTAQIIREYVVRYPDIIKPILQVENQYSKGINISRTYIFPQMVGKYIAVCEGDDYWCDERKLQMQYDYIENHPECVLCTHNTVKHDISGKGMDMLFNSWRDVHVLDEGDVFFGWNVHTSSYFAKKEVYMEVPEFAEKYWFGDYVVLTWAFALGKIVALPGVFSVYNYGVPDGITQRVANSDTLDRAKKNLLREEYLKKYNEVTNNRFSEIAELRMSEIRYVNTWDILKDAALKGNVKQTNTFIRNQRREVYARSELTMWGIFFAMLRGVKYKLISLWKNIQKRVFDG